MELGIHEGMNYVNNDRVCVHAFDGVGRVSSHRIGRCD